MAYCYLCFHNLMFSCKVETFKWLTVTSCFQNLMFSCKVEAYKWLIVTECFQNLSRRPRRNRASPVTRAAFQETDISPANFVYPLFIHEGCYFLLYSDIQWLSLLSLRNIIRFWSVAGEEDTPIGAMPGCYRLGWRHGLVQEVWLYVLI